MFGKMFGAFGQKNNMQRMVNKFCVLLGKKLGWFDRGFSHTGNYIICNHQMFKFGV